MAKKKDDEELTPSEKKLAKTKAKVEMREYRGKTPLTSQFYNYLQRLENAPDATAAGSAIRQFGGAFSLLPITMLDQGVGKLRKAFGKNKDISKAEEKRLVKMFEDRMKKVGGKSGRPSPLTRKGREEKAATQEAILSTKGLMTDSDIARDALLNMDPDEYRRRISDYGMKRTLERDAYKKGGKVKTKPKAKPPTNKAGGRVKKMNAGGRVKSKEKLANIETGTQKRKRKTPPSIQKALDANKGKSKATITKGIYKRLAKDRGIEYPKRRGSAKSGSAGGLKPSTILEGKLPGKKRMKSGGLVKKMDGIAIRGKTKGRIV